MEDDETEPKCAETMISGMDTSFMYSVYFVKINDETKLMWPDEYERTFGVFRQIK